MTRTLFLHAGPPKTGSTAIQRFFRDNAEVFRRQGLFRPVTGTEHRSHYHFDLVEAFQPERPDHPLRALLQAEIDAAGRPERLFLSAEHFAQKLANTAYVKALSDFCRHLGYRLHVIAYVRPQAPLLNSLYTQNVKSWRQVPAIDSFVRREIETHRHDPLRLFASLEAEADIDLTLRPFNKDVLANGLTADMCRIMGLSVSGETLAADEEEANVSPGPMTVAAFERLRRRIARTYPMLTQKDLSPLTWPLLRAAGAEGWNKDKYGGITPATDQLIAQSFRNSNQALSRRHWGKDWDEVFAPRETAAPPYKVFDPEYASQTERRAFRDFIEAAMEMVESLPTASPALTSPTTRPQARGTRRTPPHR